MAPRPSALRLLFARICDGRVTPSQVPVAGSNGASGRRRRGGCCRGLVLLVSAVRSYLQLIPPSPPPSLFPLYTPTKPLLSAALNSLDHQTESRLVPIHCRPPNPYFCP